MSLASWLRGLRDRLENARPRQVRKQSRRPVRRACRPRLEALEDRTTPSVLTVTNALADGSAGSLRSAVVRANADAAQGISDTINFNIPTTDPGYDSTTGGFTIALTQGQLELSGASGAAVITIDAGTANIAIRQFSSNTRVFQVDAGMHAEFHGLTITGGHVSGGFGDGGGGIYNAGTLTVSRCTLSGNAAYAFGDSGGHGGGIMNGGTLTLINSTLSGNEATGAPGDGGGIYNVGTLTVSGCTLSGNTGIGIVSAGGSTLTVSDSTLSGNTRGGILTTGGAPTGNPILTVSRCTVSGNGGAGISTGASGDVSGCTVSSNRGRGIDFITFVGRTLNVSNCTVTGNSLGGVSNSGGRMTVTNCTLSGNSNNVAGAGAVGGGVYNTGTMAVTGCTVSGNSIGSGSGIGFDGGGIYNVGTLTVSASILSGNSAFYHGGGIYNVGTLTVSASTLSGNSAGSAGGGVYNDRLPIYNDDGTVADYVVGTLTIDSNSAVCDNQAPYGADVDNLGALSIFHSAVVRVKNQNLGATIIDVDTTDTATALTSSVNPQGQTVFTVKVLAAKTGTAVRTGTVALYNVFLVGTATLGPTGQATFSGPALPAGPPPLQAVYSSNSNFRGSASAPLIQTVGALKPDSLQPLVNSVSAANVTAVALQAGDEASWQAALSAVNAVTAPVLNGAPVPVTVVLNLAPGTYSDMTYSNSDPNVHFILNGSTVGGGTVVNGHSPALLVTAGDVTILNATFTTATDSPTILLAGGRLTLRDCIVQESTDSSDAAIAVTGGSLDLGTADSPGGNTINVNGTGQVLLNTGLNLITAVGNAFQADGSAIFPVATTTLVSSANPALPNQPITLTANVGAPNATSASPTGSVTFVDLTSNITLGTVSLAGGGASLPVSALALGSHTIAAIYSGDAQYVPSAVTLVETVQYGFSGFLAPLSANLAFALGRTVPIKFQLTDYKGFVASLSAITSLRVLDAGGTNVLTKSGGPALRYDPTAHQFVANWQTKGLSAGAYTVELVLADGTTTSQTVQLTASGGSAKVEVEGSGDATASAGALLGGDVALYVDNGNGGLTGDELARIDAAVAAVNVILAPYGVTITEVAGPAAANVTLHMATTSPVGGYDNCVLGCTTDAGEITLIQGWSWYAGGDAGAIGGGQYDFETVVIHELGHALGLGHSAESGSVMYATLSSGAVKHTLTTADLSLPNGDRDGADGLHAVLLAGATGAGVPALEAPAVGVSIETGGSSNSVNRAGQAVIPASLFGAADFNFAWRAPNGDGRLDRMLNFRTQDTSLHAIYEQLLADDIDADGALDSNHQELDAALTGQTGSDDPFVGVDQMDLFLSGKALRQMLDELAAAGVV